MVDLNFSEIAANALAQGYLTQQKYDELVQSGQITAQSPNLPIPSNAPSFIPFSQQQEARNQWLKHATTGEIRAVSPSEYQKASAVWKQTSPSFEEMQLSGVEYGKKERGWVPEDAGYQIGDKVVTAEEVRSGKEPTYQAAIAKLQESEETEARRPQGYFEVASDGTRTWIDPSTIERGIKPTFEEAQKKAEKQEAEYQVELAKSKAQKEAQNKFDSFIDKENNIDLVSALNSVKTRKDWEEAFENGGELYEQAITTVQLDAKFNKYADAKGQIDIAQAVAGIKDESDWKKYFNDNGETYREAKDLSEALAAFAPYTDKNGEISITEAYGHVPEKYWAIALSDANAYREAKNVIQIAGAEEYEESMISAENAKVLSKYAVYEPFVGPAVDEAKRPEKIFVGYDINQYAIDRIGKGDNPEKVLGSIKDMGFKQQEAWNAVDWASATPEKRFVRLQEQGLIPDKARYAGEEKGIPYYVIPEGKVQNVQYLSQSELIDRLDSKSKNRKNEMIYLALSESEINDIRERLYGDKGWKHPAYYKETVNDIWGALSDEQKKRIAETYRRELIVDIKKPILDVLPISSSIRTVREHGWKSGYTVFSVGLDVTIIGGLVGIPLKTVATIPAKAVGRAGAAYAEAAGFVQLTREGRVALETLDEITKANVARSTLKRVAGEYAELSGITAFVDRGKWAKTFVRGEVESLSARANAYVRAVQEEYIQSLKEYDLAIFKRKSYKDTYKGIDSKDKSVIDDLNEEVIKSREKAKRLGKALKDAGKAYDTLVRGDTAFSGKAAGSAYATVKENTERAYKNTLDIIRKAHVEQRGSWTPKRTDLMPQTSATPLKKGYAVVTHVTRQQMEALKAQGLTEAEILQAAEEAGDDILLFWDKIEALLAKRRVFKQVEAHLKAADEETALAEGKEAFEKHQKVMGKKKPEASPEKTIRRSIQEEAETYLEELQKQEQALKEKARTATESERRAIIRELIELKTETALALAVKLAMDTALDKATETELEQLSKTILKSKPEAKTSQVVVTKTKVKEGTKTGTKTSPVVAVKTSTKTELGTVVKVQPATRVATATVTKAATKAAVGVKDATATKTATAVKVGLKTAVVTKIKTIPKTKTAVSLKTIIVPKLKPQVKTKVKPPKKLLVPGSGKEKGKKTKRIPIGSVCWKHLSGWMLLVPPYHQSNLTWRKTRPSGAIEVKDGVSAKKTAQSISGKVPKLVTVDVGIQDLEMKFANKKLISVRFKPDFQQRTRSQVTVKGVRQT